MKAELWIDGGTTNTRLTLTAQGIALERTACGVGASAGGEREGNRALRQAITGAWQMMAARQNAHITQVCLSGMITSASGLVEVPHLPAPVGLSELARGVRAWESEGVFPVPALCVPGVRCGQGAQADMMRGEETEAMGLDHPASGRTLLLHFGSHDKLLVLEAGKIVRSVTTLTGELLAAVTEHTILHGTLGSLQEFPLDGPFAQRGYAAAGAHGLSRALFQTRQLSVLEKAEPAQAWSFLFGALVRQDAEAYAQELSGPWDELILYGRATPAQAFLHCASALIGNRPARVIPYAESEWLSLWGMRRILAERGAQG